MENAIIIEIILLSVEAGGFAVGGKMYGDIGIAAMLGAIGAFLSGIGIIVLGRHILVLENKGSP